MRRRAAQQVCPDLILVPADPGRDAREFEPVVVAAETVVAGLEVTSLRLLGIEESPGALADELVGRLAEALGYRTIAAPAVGDDRS
jgi:protein ImuB